MAELRLHDDRLFPADAATRAAFTGGTVMMRVIAGRGVTGHGPVLLVAHCMVGMGKVLCAGRMGRMRRGTSACQLEHTQQQREQNGGQRCHRGYLNPPTSLWQLCPGRFEERAGYAQHMSAIAQQSG